MTDTVYGACTLEDTNNSSQTKVETQLLLEETHHSLSYIVNNTGSVSNCSFDQNIFRHFYCEVFPKGPFVKVICID